MTTIQARELVETVCVNKSGASLFTVLILGLLKAKELAPAAGVCRKWRRMAVDDSLWEKFCKPYPMLAVLRKSSSWLNAPGNQGVDGQTWKRLYGQ